MNEHHMHQGHAHAHGAGCGHRAVRHEGHTDYLHDGHLHHLHGDHVDEHEIPISRANGDGCTPGHACGEHDPSHTHGPACGHPSVPHGEHLDYVVKDHLHHPHGAHCDDHGLIDVA